MPAVNHDEIETPSAWMTWPLLAAMLVLVLGSLNPALLADPDTLWHIAAGRWIVTHQQLPATDMFSWSMPGTPWTAHEWLSEVILYGVWATGGFHAVVILVTACFALTAAYIVRYLCTRMEPQQVPAVALLVLGMMETHFLARPHVMAWPLLAIWTGTLVTTVDEERSPPWWLLLVLLAWANLHASFTLALGIAAALALDALVSAPSAARRQQILRRWGLFGLGTLVACAINPNGLGTLQHAVHMMQMKEMLALISEWKSADFHEFQLILVWMFVVVGLALTGRLRLAPVRTVLLLGLLYMALKHVRYQSTLALASIFLLATPLGIALRIRRGASGSEPQAATLDAIMRRLSAATRPLAIGLAVVLASVWFVVARDRMPSEPVAHIVPQRALAAYQAAGLGPGRLLNSYKFGGYLIFRDIPVFIDGRADMYGDPFLKALDQAVTLKTPHSLESLLDQHQITWTLLATNSAAVEVLDHLPNWRRLYGDSVAVVHVRQSAPVAPTTPRAPVSPTPPTLTMPAAPTK